MKIGIVLVLLAVLLALLLVVSGPPEGEGDGGGATQEALVEAAFAALQQDDVEPLRPFLANAEDQDWFIGLLEQVGGQDEARRMRERLAHSADQRSPGEQMAAQFPRAREGTGAVEWRDATFLGIDETKTIVNPTLEGLRLASGEVELLVENAEIVFLVKSQGATHALRIGSIRRPGRGWVAWGLPTYTGLEARSEKIVARLTLKVEFERARNAGHFDPASDRDAVMTHAMAVLRERLVAFQVIPPDLVRIDDETIAVGVPDGMESESLATYLTRSGGLDFRIEVRPNEQYPHPPDEPIARLQDPSTSPWHGTAEEFAAYKAAEVARWKAAQAAEEMYVPSDERYFVALREGDAGDTVEGFAVLETPSEGDQRFGAEMLQNPKVTADMRGLPVVIYDIKTERQDAFGVWTEANIGLPMAMVVDGTYRVAPVIRSRLTDAVQISLETRDRASMQQEAQELVGMLQAGALRVPLTLVSVEAIED